MTIAIDNPAWRLRRGFTAPLPPGSHEVGDPDWTRPTLPDGQLGAHLKFKVGLRLEDYIDESLQPPSAVSRPHPGFNWGMLANDRYGDCVIAMMLHVVEDWHLNAGTAVPPFTDQDAVQMYSAISGFNPNDPNSDQGTDESKAMAYWQDPGLKVQGQHQIAAAVAVDPGNLLSCRRAIYEFGALMLAVSLPTNAQGQTEWAVRGDPNHDPDAAVGSWGGHGIPAREYDPDDFKVITWGTELLMTVGFHEAYVAQAFVVVSQEMLNNQGTGPSGVAWGDLVSDIHQLSGPKVAQPKTKAPGSKPRNQGHKEETS